MANRIVIGAGKYGANYAKILAELPDTNTLILTRTTEERARSLAEKITTETQTKSRVMGIKATSSSELLSILDQYRPDFVGITSKDERQGDAIHIEHTTTALEHPSHPFVLCDKPFSSASGNGASLNYLKHLIENPELAKNFDLQLPVTRIMRVIMKDAEFFERFKIARYIGVCWGANKPEKRDAVNSLSSHAWCVPSALYYVNEIESVDVANEGQCARIKARLINEKRSGINCSMNLRYDQDLRGFEIDGYNIVVQTKGSTNRILQVSSSLDEIAANGGRVDDSEIARTIAIVENPLRMNIESAISRTPVNSIFTIYESQLFLERVMKNIRD